MKINSTADDRITVELTKQDMAMLDITYEDMDYSTTETRRVIWTLLDEAEKVLGKELDPSRRMIIEATPDTSGGCILDFIILDSKKKNSVHRQQLRKQSENLLCDFENSDLLLRAAMGFRLNCESSLYENGGNYRLIIRALCEADTVKRYFSEFSCVKSCDRLLLEHTKEHWRLITEKSAIEALKG